MASFVVMKSVFSIFFCIGFAKSLNGNNMPGDPCETDKGIMGYCEEVESCLQDGGVVHTSDQAHRCQGGDQGNIYVCCRKPHLIAKELCEAWSHYWRDDEGKCNADGDNPLIIGGQKADIGEFPHMVLFGNKFGLRPINWFCGGTLISPHFVLTAAHCLYNYREGMTYWVKLGEHDLEHSDVSNTFAILKGHLPHSLYGVNDLLNNPSPDSAVPSEQVIEVVKEYIHPDHDLSLKYHDIALLRLGTPVKFTKRVLPACLPYEYPADDYKGQRLSVIGWGHTSSIRELSRTLQKVDVPVVNRLECSTTSANLQRLTPVGITEDMICAGEIGKDSCQGDSGGPLTTRVARNGIVCEHMIVGVVSFGIGTDRHVCGALGVYGRVSSYLGWITGHIAPNVSVNLRNPTAEAPIPIF